MATGTATEQLDRIEELVKAQKQQDLDIWIAHSSKLDDYYAQIEGISIKLSNINTQLISIGNTLSDNLPGIPYYLGVIQQPILEAIRDALELLNNNGSQNAQNAQTLQISGALACCDNFTPTENIPADLCQRAQALATRMQTLWGKIADFAYQGTVPTREQLRQLYNFVDWDTLSPYKISDSDIVDLQGELLSVGVSNLGLMTGAQSDDTLFASVVNLIFNAGSAAQAIAQLQTYALNIGEADPIIKVLIHKTFTPTLINYVFAAGSTMGQEAFDENYCGEVDPPDDFDYIDRFDLLVDDSPTTLSTADFNFAPGESVGPGDQFCVAIIASSGAAFGGGQVITVPNEDLVGTFSDVGDEVCYYIEQGVSSLSVQFNGAPEGENYIVTIEHRGTLA